MPKEVHAFLVKLLDPNCKIGDFLLKTLDPPVSESIRNAIIVLQEIGALSPDENLTDLGKRLGALPVHPLVSKMLFFAILLNCLDPAVTLACANDYRDPFTLPMLPNEKKIAAAAKSELASLLGGNSDQLAVVAAFECWKKAKERGHEARFCSQYFVSSGTMVMLSGMRKQLKKELRRHGFIPDDVSNYNLNAHDPGVLHAVLVSGFYPMVGRMLPPTKNNKRSVVETSSGDKVRIHSHSNNFNLLSKKFDGQPLIVYDEITRGDGGLYIRNCSVVGPLPLLLLATEIVVAPAKDTDDGEDESYSEDTDEYESDEDESEMQDKSDGRRGEKIMSSPENAVKVVVDRWLYFESTALDVAQIYCLRERLNAAIVFKVTYPGKDPPELFRASTYAIDRILSCDGLSGIQLPLESVDSLASMVNATEIDQSAPGRREQMDQNSVDFLKSLIWGCRSRQRSHTNYRKSMPPVSKGPKCWNSPLIDNIQPPIASAGMNPSQRFAPRGPNGAGYPYGPNARNGGPNGAGYPYGPNARNGGPNGAGYPYGPNARNGGSSKRRRGY